MKPSNKSEVVWTLFVYNYVYRIFKIVNIRVFR